jgi:uncharacterized ferritin-like protein (DUF455 family)
MTGVESTAEALRRADWFAAAGVVDDGSAEAWARAYILAPTPAHKLAPPIRASSPAPPWATDDAGPTSVVARCTGGVSGGAIGRAEPVHPAPDHPAPLGPGRAAPYVVGERAERTPARGALTRPTQRARLLHTFLHHEVQAAELMAWACLTFRCAPLRFRRGLFGVLDDEVRHAGAYAARLVELGLSYGAFPVRDWFWQRVPSVADARGFVALMGMGLEGGNLEHTRRFEVELAEAGDTTSAELVATVGREEVAHVRFATRWFLRFSGALPTSSPDFDAWRTALPAPLTPTVLRGLPLDRERRMRAGQGPEFLDRLEAW